MVEFQSRVQCLRGSSVFDLKLDFLRLSDPSEVLEKVSQLFPSSSVSLSQLHFVYSDEVTPVTHLDVLDQADLLCLQKVVAEQEIFDVFFQYDETGKLESFRAAKFFSKDGAEKGLDRVLAKSVSLEEAKAEAHPLKENASLPDFHPVAPPFTLAINKDQPVKSTLKRRDLTIIRESSLLEPEPVTLNSVFTHSWRLLVSGDPWQHAAAICLKGQHLGASFRLTKIAAELEVEVSLQMNEDSASIAFRVELDGECCGPLLWVEAIAHCEPTVEERLIELGALPQDIDKLKSLIEVGLTDLPKLMKAWKDSIYHQMNEVANLYYGEGEFA